MESDSDLDISESGSESSFSSLDSEDSDVEVDVLADARQWCAINNGELPPSPPRFPFLSASKINVDFDANADILQFIEIFFDEDLVTLIVNETNRYAEQYMQGENSSQRLSQWHPTTNNEIRTFLAVILLQSIVSLPEQKLFWSKNPLLQVPIFPKIISYRRFLLLKKFLHFSDNASYEPASHPCPKLNKIWPVVKDLNEKFKKCYTPDRDITIDESLMLYKGRLGWVQYIPQKRAKFGIKTFMLCESKSGYIWNSVIYTGKGTIFDTDYQNLPISSQIVMSLVAPLLGKGYCLITDNFYTSPQLADILLKYRTDTYGTVRLSRKDMPENVKRNKLKRGDIVASQRGKVTVMKWKDKKDVSLLSTIHNSDIIDVTKNNKTVKKPRVVVDYNTTMGGVDRVDQHLANYPVPRKRGKKYYKKIFFHLYEQANFNSYVLYKKSGGRLSPLDYRLLVIEKMFEKYHSQEFSSRGGRPGTTPSPLRLTGRHFPESIPATEKKKTPTRQCIVCSSKRDEKGKRVRRESRYFCPDCDVGLCVAPCFRLYHTKANC